MSASIRRIHQFLSIAMSTDHAPEAKNAARMASKDLKELGLSITQLGVSQSNTQPQASIATLTTLYHRAKDEETRARAQNTLLAHELQKAIAERDAERAEKERIARTNAQLAAKLAAVQAARVAERSAPKRARDGTAAPRDGGADERVVEFDLLRQAITRRGQCRYRASVAAYVLRMPMGQYASWRKVNRIPVWVLAAIDRVSDADLAPTARKRWTPEDDEMLIKVLDATSNDLEAAVELSKRLGRRVCEPTLAARRRRLVHDGRWSPVQRRTKTNPGFCSRRSTSARAAPLSDHKKTRPSSAAAFKPSQPSFDPAQYRRLRSQMKNSAH